MAFFVLYSIKDEKNRISTTEINAPTGLTLANLSIYAAEVAKLIDAVIKGAITRIGVGFAVDLPGTIRTTPLPDSDVEEGAEFQWRTSGGFFSSNRLPTFDEALLLAGTTQVDVADTDVAAFITAIRDGLNLVPAGGTGTVSACDKREEDIVALDYALENFQSSRKRSR